MQKQYRLLICLLLGLVTEAQAQPRERRGPPLEALQACSGLQEGATCSFTLGDKQISGTCRTGPTGEAAACLPSGHPRGHFGPPPEAVQACSNLENGAGCSFTLHGHEISGACQQNPEGTRVCRPQGAPPASGKT
jgi:hypothetical protein